MYQQPQNDEFIYLKRISHK